jgi:hypothetical protein
MPNPRDLCRGHKRLRPWIEYALSEGWQVVRTPGGHLKFTKAGLAPVFTGSTPSDHRTDRNARSQLRRAGQIPTADDGDRTSGGSELG